MKRKFGVRRFNRKVAVGMAAGAALAAVDAQAVPIHVDDADVTISPENGERELRVSVSNLVNPRTDVLPDFLIAWINPPDTTPQNLEFTGLNNIGQGLSNPLNPGTLIGGRGQSFVDSFNLATANAPDTLPAGAWVGLSNTFLGFQVDVPGASPHFGWLGASLDNAGNFTLHDLAIESEANTPIRAGQTAVPQISTLALLALGAAGLAASRRGHRSA